MVPWFKEMVRDNVGTLFGQVDEKPPVLTAAQIGGLALPTLLIGGAPGPHLLPPCWTHSRAGCRARRIDIAGSSHGMNLGNPRAFNGAIDDFLNGLG